MKTRPALIAALLAALGLTMLTSCASDGRARRGMPHVEEHVLLDGRHEVPGMYTRGDGFGAASYTLTPEGTFEWRFFSDNIPLEPRPPLLGTWRLVDERSVEIAWTAPDGSAQTDRLHFVAVDDKLGFFEAEQRSLLEAKRIEWRTRAVIYVKHKVVKMPKAAATAAHAPRTGDARSE